MRIGFIGLGIMGSAMASNLAKAGFPLTVWNRSPEKSLKLKELGADVGKSPRDVAETADIVFAMMADPASVRSVRDGENGIIAGLKPGKGYVDMSTVDPETSMESAGLTGASGAAFLEAPVAGSRKPAEEGTLTVMAAGSRVLYEAAFPALEKMGKKILYLGETGNAARMKLVNNLIMGGMLAALAEGISLAGMCGIDSSQLLEVLDSGAVSNPMFRLKGPQMAADGDFPAAFPLKHMQKDLRLALRLAEESGQPLFATATVNELYKKALAMGLGDLDFAAVSKAVRV